MPGAYKHSPGCNCCSVPTQQCFNCGTIPETLTITDPLFGGTTLQYYPPSTFPTTPNNTTNKQWMGIRPGSVAGRILVYSSGSVTCTEDPGNAPILYDLTCVPGPFGTSTLKLAVGIPACETGFGEIDEPNVWLVPVYSGVSTGPSGFVCSPFSASYSITFSSSTPMVDVYGTGARTFTLAPA